MFYSAREQQEQILAVWKIFDVLDSGSDRSEQDNTIPHHF